MLVTLALLSLVRANIEQGKVVINTLEKNHIARIPKSLYKDAEVKLFLTLNCAGKDAGNSVRVRVVMRSTTCLSEFTNIQPTTINW